MRAVYVCYFGLREPLVQSQVLPYLREIAAGGIVFMLLTFEPHHPRHWPNGERERWRKELARDGIRWIARRYHKRPSLPATLFDMAVGTCTLLWTIHGWGARILHARAHVPLAMAVMARRGTSCRILFDLRGLLADEYAEAGHWQTGSIVFRAVKWLERHGLTRADAVVVLTQRLKDWIIEQGWTEPERIEVIPCCVDSARFEPNLAAPGHINPRFEVVYAGSVTGLYLLDEMARFFRVLQRRRPTALLRILTKSTVAEAAAVLRKAGLNASCFWIGAVPPSTVPGAFSRAGLSLSFIRASWSKIASCPTKIPEYLAAGIPVVSSAGMGDLDRFLVEEQVGVILRSYDDHDLEAAVEQALAMADDPTMRVRCIEAARRHFDLRRVGGPRYRKVYRSLLEVEARPRMSECRVEP